jgi:hypothetical protein
VATFKNLGERDRKTAYSKIILKGQAPIVNGPPVLLCNRCRAFQAPADNVRTIQVTGVDRSGSEVCRRALSGEQKTSKVGRRAMLLETSRPTCRSEGIVRQIQRIAEINTLLKVENA